MFQKIGFMFAGQGAQTVGMGKDLAEAVPAVRDWFGRADDALGRPISEICFNGPQDALTKSANCQPAITATSLACLIAFQQRFPGVKPVACGGLSLGEFAALAAAGVVGFEDAVKLVAARGQFFEDACRATEGGMAAVLNGDAAVIEKVCAAAGVDVANYNCPGQIVISGEKAKLPAAIEGLKAAGISKVIPLTVDGAFHSRLMGSAVPRFAEVLKGVELRAPQCVVVQNVVGGPVADPAQIRPNLEAQITGSVRWEQCARAMIAAGAEALVEFGPGTVLGGFMKRIDKQFPMFNVGSAADLEKLAADPRFQ
jgi:[acyl-carrier-protein] S-malonyltransferase